MAKTLLMTWRDMTDDPELKSVLPRAGAGENEEKEPAQPASAHVVAEPIPSKKPMAAFVKRMQDEHANNGFEIVYFDGSPYSDGLPLNEHLKRKVPDNLDIDLKIYISGHGGIGTDAITNDKQSLRKSVDELAKLLAHALRDRATNMARSSATRINMVSCRFARTPDGKGGSSPAAKLHRSLMNEGIYVDLVGRTESISALKEGISTVNMFDSRINLTVYGEASRFYEIKVPHTKVLHRVGTAGQQVIERPQADHQSIGSETLIGRQLSWADRTVERIVNRLKTDASGTINDGRQQALADIVERYYAHLNMARLREQLQALVQSNKRLDVNKNFMLHRGGTMSKMFRPVFNVKPASAVFVESLLRDFPTR